ncbi:MAG: N-acetyltransferase [Alphaproteobacteria bacterium]|nr:MAG: N-acetyltransferase [Alphaproteobacteria bacterium]
MFTIRDASLSEIMKAHALVPEFGEGGDVDFAGRLSGTTSLSIIGLAGDAVAGYAVCYLKDNCTAYIWMVGTLPDYRRQGVYQQLFTHIHAWAVGQGATRLVLKTRNNKRHMLAWLVKNDFLFTEIEPQDDISQNRILTEKLI